MNVRFTELRKSPRIEVNLKVKLFAMGNSLRTKEVFYCTVVNISEGGALIVASTPIVDDEFYLEIKAGPGGLVACTVVRRESMFKVAVRFT